MPPTDAATMRRCLVPFADSAASLRVRFVFFIHACDRFCCCCVTFYYNYSRKFKTKQKTNTHNAQNALRALVDAAPALDTRATMTRTRRRRALGSALDVALQLLEATSTTTTTTTHCGAHCMLLTSGAANVGPGAIDDVSESMNFADVVEHATSTQSRAAVAQVRFLFPFRFRLISVRVVVSSFALLRYC